MYNISHASMSTTPYASFLFRSYTSFGCRIKVASHLSLPFLFKEKKVVQKHTEL
jgi:hypothetical protein